MFSNTTEFNRAELTELFGSDSVYQLPENSRGVSTDTRSLVSGNIFVALHGEIFDGHEKIDDAIANGAALVVIDNKAIADKLSTEHKSYPHILVPNTLHALGQLARFHRNRFTIPIVAIAGASGKTSTKDLTAHVLSEKFSTLKTSANYNNQIGVPLTLLQLTHEHQAAVIEIGTNEPGEIEILSRITAPTHGLITNIGKEHLEKLIDLDGVEHEETALFRYLHDSNGIALVNLDDERLKKYRDHSSTTRSFGMDSSAEIAVSVHFTYELHPILSFTSRFEVELEAFGYAAALNAMAAVAVGVTLGMTNAELQRALESFEQPPAHGYGRMNVEQVHDIIILNDCYNANPDSMRIALKTLALYPARGRRIAILGDMRELGAAATEEHLSLISDAEACTDILLILGEEMLRAAAQLINSNSIFMNSKQECINFIRTNQAEGDVVLVKGSRGMAMEDIIEGIAGGR
ncbi:MAG: UDP-N-acetylmuramoyl-tripeptide--D-alanyl-D-alanine ligase [Ignavibacteria bacterium]|nr:UDP-N-acetylmuramoyl-tripeptide--D-alanyl-D-alanine ligase [Ignavibacteria bacterium]